MRPLLQPYALVVGVVRGRDELQINELQSSSVENGAAFATDSLLVCCALTPTLSQGERGLPELAFSFITSGKIAINCQAGTRGSGRIGGRDGCGAVAPVQRE